MHINNDNRIVRAIKKFNIKPEHFHDPIIYKYLKAYVLNPTAMAEAKLKEVLKSRDPNWSLKPRHIIKQTPQTEQKVKEIEEQVKDDLNERINKIFEEVISEWEQIMKFKPVEPRKPIDVEKPEKKPEKTPEYRRDIAELYDLQTSNLTSILKKSNDPNVNNDKPLSPLTEKDIENLTGKDLITKDDTDGATFVFATPSPINDAEIKEMIPDVSEITRAVGGWVDNGTLYLDPYVYVVKTGIKDQKIVEEIANKIKEKFKQLSVLVLNVGEKRGKIQILEKPKNEDEMKKISEQFGGFMMEENGKTWTVVSDAGGDLKYDFI